MKSHLCSAKHFVSHPQLYVDFILFYFNKYLIVYFNSVLEKEIEHILYTTASNVFSFFRSSIVK